VTTSMSPGWSLSTTFRSSVRSPRAPEAFSEYTLAQPAAWSSASWPSRHCSRVLTRAYTQHLAARVGSPYFVRWPVFPSRASRRRGPQIHFHAPPHPGGAMAIEFNRLNYPGQTGRTAGTIHRKERDR
jgi:hypothetical protein